MKVNLLFKDSAGHYKGEKEGHYDTQADAEKEGEYILSVLNEISDKRVSYELTVSDDPNDILIHSNRSRELTRNRYRYFYTERQQEFGIDEPATYTVPDLGIELTAEYGTGLQALKQVVRVHLERLVDEGRPFPESKEVEDRKEKYPDGVDMGMIAVTLNPVIEKKKEKERHTSN
jgi:hypothetical protein